MTEIETTPTATADSWQALLDTLRVRYPNQKDSVLFCIHKLHQNQDLTLPDFRDEAAMHGISLAGRALHSAKVQLGLVKAKPRVNRSKAAPKTEASRKSTEHSERSQRHGSHVPTSRIEAQLLETVRKIQSSADDEADRLRRAIQDAITVLQRALEA